MSNLETSVLEQPEFSPKIYCRYVDDMFVVVNIDVELELLELESQMERQSVLKFSYEIGIDNKPPFLDVEVSSNCSTKVYRKPTDK